MTPQGIKQDARHFMDGRYLKIAEGEKITCSGAAHGHFIG